MIAKKDIVIAKLVFIGDKRELISIHQRASQQVYIHKLECEFTDIVDDVPDVSDSQEPKAKNKGWSRGKTRKLVKNRK